MIDLAEAEGWPTEEPTEGEGGPVAMWRLRDGTEVAWHEDEMTGIGFATVHGPSAEAVRRTMTKRLDVLEPAQYRRFVAAQPTARDVGHALYAIAVASEGSPADAEIEGLFLETLADDDALVRQYALLASSLVATPALRVAIRSALDDPDEEVRATATEVVADLDGPVASGS